MAGYSVTQRIKQVSQHRGGYINPKELKPMALADIEEEIAYEESRLHIHIVGDRRDFDKARREWKGLSKMQVAYIASTWRNAIYTRYMNK